MKKRLSVLLLVSSAAAVIVRLLQQIFGFEAVTGLPVHSFLFTLPILLLLLLWFGAVRPLPDQDLPGFPQGFPLTKNSLFLPVAGIFLIALSGVAWLFFGMMPQASQAIAADGTLVSVVTTGPLSFGSMTILGILHLIMAVCLFPAAAACRVREDGSFKPISSAILMAPPVILVIRLVLIYRVNSVDPLIAHYAVELLAMAALTLAFYRLAGFSCGVGGSRRFVLYAGWAVILGLASLPAGQGIPDLLFYLGTSLLLLGLVTARLQALENK